MQRIPTLSGFSIIILVLVLMVINHIIYMEILDRSMESVNSAVVTTPAQTSTPPPASEVQVEESDEGEYFSGDEGGI